MHLGPTPTDGGWRPGAPVFPRAFCPVSATVANFTALRQLPLSVTSGILFFSPVFIRLFARPIPGEAVSPRHRAGVALGFADVLSIIWPFDADID